MFICMAYFTAQAERRPCRPEKNFYLTAKGTEPWENMY